ncbi:MAG: cytochrome c peroxidase, partial [Bacteroidota bacterium]
SGMVEIPPPPLTPIELAAKGFPDMFIPQDNPTTKEGINLGRMLFYDPILSGDSSQACASCHSHEFAFSDNGRQFSVGIDGIAGTRNAPALVNVGWLTSSFWDGRNSTLEEQALEPVANPIEMHEDWTDAVLKLQSSEVYTGLFNNVFGDEVITPDRVVKAIAQFERTLISNNSKYDKFLNRELQLSEEEYAGFLLFFSEDGECFHCHGTALLTNNGFHNIGLDAEPVDIGWEAVTGNPADRGKFKTPTLRNIEYSAPYMHDGRFETLEEVMDFYSEGVKPSSNVDPLIRTPHLGGFQFTEEQKQQLITFMKTFSDEDFMQNEDFSDPHQ